MAVQRGESERRYVQVEVEVPGTPEEVWKAIATGPGISAWFVPTEVDEREGGTAKSSFGPGMDSYSTIKEWHPPLRTTMESKDLGEDAPAIATEWIVEAASGDTCIVRVVHSLFTSSAEWDSQLEAWEAGWPDFFRLLRLYLTHFAGQTSAQIQLSAMTSLSAPDAWTKLTEELGVVGASKDDECTIAAEGTPTLTAIVERVGGAGHPQELILRTSDPMPGFTHWFTLAMGKQTVVSMRFYIYGDDAAAVVARLDTPWQEWIATLFPAGELPRERVTCAD